jgi:hypothetical protein
MKQDAGKINGNKGPPPAKTKKEREKNPLNTLDNIYISAI